MSNHKRIWRDRERRHFAKAQRKPKKKASHILHFDSPSADYDLHHASRPLYPT